MKTGQQQEVILNYCSLYKLNPKTARVVVLEVFKQTSNISRTARMFSTTRKVVQLAIKNEVVGNLDDGSHVNLKVHNRTSEVLEEKVIAVKNSTSLATEE